MSSQQASPRSIESKTALLLKATERGWVRLEKRLEQIGDQLNPILVKETRQAIKSSQFSITFALVLVAVWIVTFVVSSQLGPGVAYGASGPEFFWWYQLILLFPLAVIVPFTAYRSLASEREDNTYDLLSISTLAPRQIVVGKLLSSTAQMIVYLSAVAPCLAFTYLLRGIDVLTIFILITYSVLGSLALSMIGLLLATSAKQRYGQVLLSVAFVVGLVVAFGLGLSGSYGFIESSHALIDTGEFWIVNLALLTFYLTTMALLFLAAAAQLTFASDNRSTPIRIAMFVQQSCFLGWLTYLFVRVYREMTRSGGTGPIIEEFVLVAAVVAGAYWFAMGAMLTAEWHQLSRRVRRTLPRSFAARMLFTWFNPGPGTGYVFATVNLWMVAGFALVSIWIIGPLAGIASRNSAEVSYFIVIGVSYVVLYLGMGRLLLGFLQRFTRVPMLAAVLLHTVLLAAGCLVPVVVNLVLEEVGYTRNYSLLHVTNPFWTLERIEAAGTGLLQLPLIAVLVPGAACIVFASNLLRVAREVRYVRTAVPERVTEDEIERNPPPQQPPQSPWDGDTPGA